MKLMIIESPGKKKKLEEILSKIRPGESWRIEASVGHVRDLPATGQGANDITSGVRADFMPTYELTERGSDVVAKLERAVSNASEVYLATDPDREGESIAWHLKEALALKSPIRVAFNEISEGKVRDSLAAPGRIDMKMVGAQEARRVLDRLVGYMVSPELKRQTGERLSAGRVQSPAVYLVVKREREIQAFKVTAHFGARLIFAGAKTGETWEAEWMTAEGFVTDESPYFMDRRYAELVAAVRGVVVSSCEETDQTRNPPAPFTTSTMQQAASNALKWNPDTAMKIAQQLYEQGHISYHRSDNPNVSEEAMPEIRAVAQSLGLEVVEKRRVFKAKEGSQEGHPGITPTHWEVEVAGETPEQRELYKLIRIRALASQLMPALYKVRTVYLQAAEPVEGKTVKFGAAGRTLVRAGWKALLANDATADDDEEGEGENPIPMLSPGSALSAANGELLEKKTKAPKRYTEASLVKALEAEGVGRPATYAAILNNIIHTRGYISVDKNRQLRPEPVGELVIQRLEGKFSFLDIGFTRDLEEDLDKIAAGQAQYKGVIQKLHSSLDAEIKGQVATVATFKKEVPVYPCPLCQKPLRRIPKGANGPFWGCTAHPDCNGTLPDEKGVPGKPKVVKLSDFPCGKCGKPLVHKKKPGKDGYDFWGCSGFSATPACKASYPNLKGNKPDMTKGR